MNLAVILDVAYRARANAWKFIARNIEYIEALETHFWCFSTNILFLILNKW